DPVGALTNVSFLVKPSFSRANNAGREMTAERMRGGISLV
ncbi:MAG: hypothetical protein HW378_2936, partial [Anaerolineales bacterium]|nr:hypothetical protein [Anaerolineales bacterium]